MQRCSYCTGMLDPATQHCQACGRAQPAQRMSALPLLCSGCGELLPARARFCRSCGQAQMTASRSCPSCGGPAPAEAQFCGDCGRPFPSATPARLPDYQVLSTPSRPDQTAANTGVGLPRAAAPAERRSYLVQPATSQANESGVLSKPTDSPEEERQSGIGLLPALWEARPTVPDIQAGSQVGVPQVPGVPAGPQVGASNVPGVPAGPQVGAPNVPGAPAGPQVGAPNVPGIPAGPQAGAPASSPLPGGGPSFTPPPRGLGSGGSGYGGDDSSGPQRPGLPSLRHVPIPKAIISGTLVIVALATAISTYLVVHALTFTPLVVTSSAFSQQCPSKTAVLLTRTTSLQNISSDPLHWQTKLTDVDRAGTLWATISPSSGTLQPDQRVTLTLTPAQSLCQDISRNTAPTPFHVRLNFSQKSLTLTDTVTPAPILAFQAVQASMPNVEQMCADTQALPPLTLTLDNSGSNVPVNWQLSITDTDPAGTIWATPGATRGHVDAEKTAALTLTPRPSLCNDLRQAQMPVPYTAHFTYTALNQTQTTTFTDTVVPPVILGFHVTLTTTAQTCNLLQPLPAIPITLDNNGGAVPITWTLTISATDPAGDVWARADTSNGTLAPSQQAMITLTPTASLCLSLVGKQTTSFSALLNYSGGGKSGQTTLMDSVTPPQAVNNLQITPQMATQGCSSANDRLTPVQVTLDNSQSTVPVDWQTNITDTDPANNVWAAANPANGTVPAGQTATLALTPIGALCTDLFFSSGAQTYTAVISQTALSQTNTVTISDTVAAPPAADNFQLASASVSQDCNQSNPLPSFTITLDNSQSNVAVDWSSAAAKWESASPSNGMVPAGGTATLTITPVAALCAALGPGTQQITLNATLSYTALGQTNEATITDNVTPISPVVNFTASPQTSNQNCASGFQLPGLNITLDNSGSNVSIQWQVSITDTDPVGNVWAIADQNSGTVNAGATGAVTITPFFNNTNSNLCRDLGGYGQTYTFTATISYSASTGESGSTTITDDVTAIIIPG